METAVRGLKALATFGLPWEQDTVRLGRAEGGVTEARGASGYDKGTADTLGMATMSCLMENL